MGGPARNLELKAVDPDPEVTLAACVELRAEDRGTPHQRDTYFHAVQGPLKLREAPPAPARVDRIEDTRLVGAGHADLLGPLSGP